MKKKSPVIIGAVYCALSSMLLFGATLSAYIDPSVLTFLIQAIAGAVIAIGATVALVWRRAKKKVNKALNIDENKNKEVESDEIVDLSEKKDETPVK